MNIEMVRLFDIYSPLLNERQRDILTLYYNEDESLSEISENIGITRQGVRDCIVKAEAILSNLENSLGLCKKNDLLSNEIENIIKLAENCTDNAILIEKLNALKDSLDL